MAENKNEIMNTLAGMILDEEKLVTYVSLSKELCIHVNESKMLLCQVVENIRQKKENIDLNVNYIISGILDSSVARTVVCTEVELDAIKKSFKSIFFEHVYSVSKGFPSVDSALLLGTNKIEDLILCTGLIKGSNCVKRTADEIGTLKSISQELLLLKEEKTPNQSHKKVKKEGVEKPISEIEKKSVPETSSKIKVEQCSPKKDLNNKTKNNQAAVKQKGIAGFFSKTNGACNKKEFIKEEKKDSSQKPIKTEDKAENIVVDIPVKVQETIVVQKSKDVMDTGTQQDGKNQKKTQTQSNSSDKTKSQTITKKNLKVDKKRKRVLSVPQSDSDTEDNDPFVNEEQMDIQIESDDEIPPTPTVNTIKITSGITNPKKKRKIVEKTYTSDDGYILTKKEEVYESCSDNDEELKSKENVASVNKIKIDTSPKENKNNTKKSKKKSSPPQNGKQATMFNFFKRDRN